MFNIVAQPNDWEREVKQGADKGLTEMQKLQKSYWQAMRDVLSARTGRVRPQKPPAQSWTAYALGRSGVWLGACMNSLKNRVWVEFCCYGPPGKVWFEELLGQKEAIEAAVGQPLEWLRLEGKKTSKILLALDPADPTDEHDWPRQQAWLAEHLELFDKVFRPLALELSDGEGGAAD